MQFFHSMGLAGAAGACACALDCGDAAAEVPVSLDAWLWAVLRSPQHTRVTGVQG